MAAPLVQTPIQLSAHSRPRTKHASAGLLCNSHSANTCRSHVAVGDIVRLSSQGVRRRRGLVATLEQGVAIVLMDLQTQTPVHTYTLAPSDRACTPPLVVERALPGRQLVRTTYVGVCAANDTTCVWALSEALDARGKHVPGAALSKTTFDVPGTLGALYALRTGELLAARSDGTLLLLEDPLASGTVLDKCATPAVHYDAQLLDEPAARALTGDSEVVGALLLAAAKSRKHASLEAMVVTVRAAAPRLGTYRCTVPDVDTTTLESCAMTTHQTSAELATLARDGTLTTGALRVAERSLTCDARHAVHLTPAGGRLVFLSPSHLLLVALRMDKPRAAALVWDVELDAVLTSVEWSLASAGAHVAASRATEEHVLVQIEPIGDAARCSVLALPVSVPSTSLLRHALGAAARTEPWLAEASGGAAALPAPQQALRDMLLAKDPPTGTALDERFRAWLRAEEERLREVEGVRAGRKAPKPALDAALVAELLDAALPPALKASSRNAAAAGALHGGSSGAPCARDTLRYLLERGLVSAAMLDPHNALMPRAQATGDWALVCLVLRHVMDVAETHVVAVLRDALAARRDAKAPGVPRVLQHVLLPPSFSKPALRMALRTHIREDDDVLVLLDVLRVWLGAQVSAPLEGRAEPMPAEDERHVPHTDLVYRVGDARPPALGAVASFAEDVLDTFFPQLLAAPRTHAFLGEFTRVLSQHVATMQALGRLRAPLGVFASGPEPRDTRDTRSKRLALHEASLLVPSYSVETLDV